jgi:hypothetical protein
MTGRRVLPAPILRCRVEASLPYGCVAGRATPPAWAAPLPGVSERAQVVITSDETEAADEVTYRI